jgi:magnesium transporter
MSPLGTNYDVDSLPNRLETAARHVTTRVPVAAPDEPAGAVRERLTGQVWDSLADVAVCEHDRLVGLLTIETLMAADPTRPIGELMDDTPPVVSHGVDQEVAAWQMVEANESSLAVVDDDGAFVGLIPPFTIARVLLEEHDEDISRFGGVMRSTESARITGGEPINRRLWHRLPWLVIGLLGAMGSAALVAGFEQQLEDTVALAFFLPAIVYIAGAVSTQTLTLAIRGLSVGIPIRTVVWKEAVTGVLIGAFISSVFAAFVLMMGNETEVASVVGVALFGACATASLVALLLPWVLDRLGHDPAFGSGPVVTIVQDLLSLLIYFLVAAAVLG